MAIPALAAEHIAITLDGTEILRGIDFAAAPGEIVGLLGPSGAGKTTLFRVLAGELPGSGRLRLGEREVSGWPLWRRARAGLGYLPQTPSVLWSLTVKDNIRVFCRAAFNPPPPDLAGSLLEELELAPLADTRAAQLSGGERRRLELVRVFLGRPKVLLCDEPFTGLDPHLAARAARLLRSCADSGTTLLIADHRVDLCLGICDRAALLVDGRIALTASPADFRAHPLVTQRYLDAPNEWAVQPTDPC